MELGKYSEEGKVWDEMEEACMTRIARHFSVLPLLFLVLSLLTTTTTTTAVSTTTHSTTRKALRNETTNHSLVSISLQYLPACCPVPLLRTVYRLDPLMSLLLLLLMLVVVAVKYSSFSVYFCYLPVLYQSTFSCGTVIAKHITY